ncbi:MAG: DUF2007 domain-containing protein, partial [Chloroflexi bacterium]|nr:DUF2007 domain-containing protein [Chloroflexota bacterium]
MPEPRDRTPKGVDVNSADVVVVYVSQGPLGAEVARGKLASAGIPCSLRYPSVGRIWGLTVDGLGRVEVVVPAAYVADALALLADEEPPEP